MKKHAIREIVKWHAICVVCNPDCKLSTCNCGKFDMLNSYRHKLVDHIDKFKKLDKTQAKGVK